MDVEESGYMCEFTVSRVFPFRFVSVVPNVVYCWAWFALAQVRCVCKFCIYTRLCYNTFALGHHDVQGAAFEARKY